MDDIPRTAWYRLFEILPGAVSWTVLIGPFIAAFWFPRTVAILVTAYVLLWFLRVMKASAFLLHAYLKSRRFEKLNWLHLLDFFSQNPPEAKTEIEKETAARCELLRERGLFKKSSDIYHVVIIPTYKEEKEVLYGSRQYQKK